MGGGGCHQLTGSLSGALLLDAVRVGARRRRLLLQRCGRARSLVPHCALDTDGEAARLPALSRRPAALCGASPGAQMNRHPPGSSGVQWLNRRDMSFRTEDSVTLCHRALQIVAELCLTGHVDREKCSDIPPLESNIPGKGYAGKWNTVLFLFCFLEDVFFR